MIMTVSPFLPMLAAPLHKGRIDDWNDWVLEEKYDGVRLVIAVEQGVQVRAWTRPRGGKDMPLRQLPPHLVTALSRLSTGVYDGELMAGNTSTDVTRLDLEAERRVVLFDLLRIGNTTITHHKWSERRRHLEGAAARACAGEHVSLSTTLAVTGPDDVSRWVEAIWSCGGEGGILKCRESGYYPGKRAPVWLKLKKLQTTVMTVVGWEATRGEIMNRGPFAIVVLEDADGHRTTVKTRDDHELDAFNRAAANIEGTLDHVYRSHPALGRKLRIEYQDRTRDGGYRHPRWDRWEEE